MRRFRELSEVLEELTSTRKTLEKTAIFVKFLEKLKSEASPEDLKLIYMLSAKSFANLEFDEETGMSTGLYVRALSRTTGSSEKSLKRRNKGDWGVTAENLIRERGIEIPQEKELTLQDIQTLIVDILPSVSGKGSQDQKINNVANVLRSCTSLEAKYFSRLILSGSLKTGAQAKLIERAYFETFPELQAFSNDIAYAWKVRRVNFGQAVEWILSDNVDEFSRHTNMEIGFPIQCMLADKGEIDIIREEPHFVESKYDGYRIQAHCDGNLVKLYSRGLEDHTESLEDVASSLKEAVMETHSVILDGEVIGYDPETGTVLPFQTVIRRKRKYERDTVASTMKTEYRIFDILYDGEDITSQHLSDRRERLEKAVKENEIVKYSEFIVTSDIEEAMKFIDQAIARGHEGGMIKQASGKYLIGERDKSWSKLKPRIFDIDGLVVGAVWGTGKRAEMLSRYYLAFPSDVESTFQVMGTAIGSGLSEELMTSFTELFRNQGTKELPVGLEIPHDIEVNFWLDPKENPPVMEAICDSFSWKVKDSSPIATDNIPRKNDGTVDLTNIGMRFPRCKAIREAGKEPNLISYVEKVILSSLSGGEGPRSILKTPKKESRKIKEASKKKKSTQDLSKFF